MMTKTQVKERLGIETDAELARIFDIGRWAVGQWPDDHEIPELRQLQLKERFPDVFAKPRKREAA